MKYRSGAMFHERGVTGQAGLFGLNEIQQIERKILDAAC
jgi:hypothetical protein